MSRSRYGSGGVIGRRIVQRVTSSAAAAHKFGAGAGTEEAETDQGGESEPESLAEAGAAVDGDEQGGRS
jgi:hypothetical protein